MNQSRHQGGYFDAQPPLGTGVPLREGFFGLANLGQNGDAARVIGRTVGGHADAAGRAVEQLHAERGFQLLDQVVAVALEAAGLSAARVMPPVSTTRTNTCMASNLFIMIVQITE